VTVGRVRRKEGIQTAVQASITRPNQGSDFSPTVIIEKKHFLIIFYDCIFKNLVESFWKAYA
jgi:hypothetical protein